MKIIKADLQQTKMVQEKFEKIYQTDEKLQLLWQKIKDYSPIIFGGFVRDVFIYKTDSNLSDIDIVLISCPDKLKVNKLIEPLIASENKFGGMRINLDTTTADLWKVQSTWAIKETNLEPNLDGLLNSVFFNWDSIAYFPNENMLYCYENYFEDILNNKLFNICNKNPNIEGNLKRLGKYQRHFRNLDSHF